MAFGVAARRASLAGAGFLSQPAGRPQLALAILTTIVIVIIMAVTAQQRGGWNM